MGPVYWYFLRPLQYILGSLRILVSGDLAGTTQDPVSVGEEWFNGLIRASSIGARPNPTAEWTRWAPRRLQTGRNGVECSPISEVDFMVLCSMAPNSESF